MENVLLGQAGGTGESNLLQRLLRNRWRSGNHREGRDRMQPAGMIALRKTFHLRHSLRSVVDVLCWDARCGVMDLYWCGLVMLWVDGGVT